MNKLRTHLAEVASAIREKKGTSEPIVAENFAAEIRSIETGGEVAVFAENMVDNGVGFTMIKNIVVPNGVTTIAPYAYYYSQTLETISLPDTITTIGIRAFRDCVKLKPFPLPPLLTEISDYMLSSLTWEELFVHEGITRIGTGACFNMQKLKTCSLPNSLQTIDPYAFESCTSLTKIHLKGNVQYIGYGAFIRSSKLSKVIIDAITPPTLGDKTAFNSTASNRLIYVPDASVDAYKSATNWSTYADAIRPLSELPNE